jgi:RHS repeat-associated protein
LGNIFVAKNPETFTYDLDGNLTSDGRWTNTWDAENRLVSMTNLASAPAGSQCSLSFTYDYMGRRIQKVVSPNTGASYTNRFVYDGWNVVAILDGANNLLYSFMWGTDLSGSMQGAGGVGGAISMTVYGTNAGTYFYCYDANGNVVALVNAANGTVAAQYEYGPFGEVIRATGPMAKINPFMFSTKYYDWETGLYYYGHRYYNPSTGRWLSRDPAEEDEGGPNLYAFCANDGVDLSDVLGMEWFIYRKGQPRAKAIATSSTDTFQDLANQAQLDINDIGLWLQQGEGNQAVSIMPGGSPTPWCAVYTIPNTVYLNRSVNWTLWTTWAYNEKIEIMKAGFNVVYRTDITDADVVAEFADKDIWGFENIAHAAGDMPAQHGEIETTDLRGLASFMPGATPVHKLGAFKLVECYGDLSWRPIVAPRGYYWFNPGKTFPTVPHGF